MTNIIIGDGQTGDGIIVGGATYAIATDWGSAGGTGFTLTHAQIVKVAWGDNYNTYRTTKLNPLPVQFYSSNDSGSTGAIVDNNYGLKVTGDVRINSTLEIAGGKIDGNLKPVVGGIIQIVGPTFGKSGPTAYGPGHLIEQNFNPIKVTGSVGGYSGAPPISITYGGGQPGRGLGEGLIRRIYGGPIGYTGYTGQSLITHGAKTNRTILDRDIDTIAIQGISGAFPVGITASRSSGLLTRRLSFPYNQTPSAENAQTPAGDRVGIIGIKGATAVEVTGGVRLSHMPAGGSFEVRNLSASRDNVAMWGADGTTGAHVKIFDSAGNPLGVSGNGALKVAIDNGVFTGTLTVSQTVYVTNATGGSLKIKGKTGDIVVVKGPLSGGAIEVASPSGLNIRNLTSSDTVSLGGQASENLGNIKDDISVSKGRLGSIQTNTERIIDKVIEFNNVVNNFEDNGTSTSSVDSGQIAFNTSIHRIYQPQELISLSRSIGTNATSLDKTTVIYNGVYVSADINNTDDIMIGNQMMATNRAAGYQLAKGESVFLQVANLNKIYVRSVSGTQTVRCIGS